MDKREYIKIIANDNKGITMVALITTMIIMVIISGITILTINGQNPLIKRAVETKNLVEQEEQETNNLMEKYKQDLKEYKETISNNEV